MEACANDWKIFLRLQQQMNVGTSVLPQQQRYKLDDVSTNASMTCELSYRGNTTEYIDVRVFLHYEAKRNNTSEFGQ